jgi:hypothetical protein
MVVERQASVGFRGWVVLWASDGDELSFSQGVGPCHDGLEGGHNGRGCPERLGGQRKPWSGRSKFVENGCDGS